MEKESCRSIRSVGHGAGGDGTAPGSDLGGAAETGFHLLGVATLALIDITACHRCGGTLRVIACIVEADVICRILDHLGGGPAPATRFDPAPPGRGPPPGPRLL